MPTQLIVLISMFLSGGFIGMLSSYRWSRYQYLHSKFWEFMTWFWAGICAIGIVGMVVFAVTFKY